MELENSKKPISVTQNVQARSLIEGDLTKYINNPIEMLFPRPYDLKDGAIRPLLCEVADYCLKNGVASENIPAALLVILTLHSVQLGYPIAIILKADDPMAIKNILNVCKVITHEEQFIEIQELSSQKLFRFQNDFKSKTIISQSPKGCKSAIPDIQNLLSEGYSSRQVSSKSQFGEELKEVHIKGPNAFIGVEIGDERFDMNHPSILRITLSTNESHRGQTLPAYRNQRFEESRIKRFFERLSQRAVDTPYGHEISSHFMNQRVEKLRFKCKPVQNLLSLLSITNNPPPFTKEEALGYFVGQNPDEIYPVVTAGPAIIATKVEYFLMTLLLKNIIPLKDEQYTLGQIIIFEAVKRINIGKLSGSTIDKENEIQVLMTLDKSSNYWAKIGDIFGRVNKTGNRISIQEIEKELKKLGKLRIITKKKFQQTSDYGYYINDTSIGKHITFLNPSEINDPKFNMASVQVVNPLTGKVVTI